MRTIMARTPHESSFSFSRRYFHRRKKAPEGEDEDARGTDEEEDEEEMLGFIGRSAAPSDEKELTISSPIPVDLWRRRRRPSSGAASLARLKSALSPLFHRTHHGPSSGRLGSKVIGTLFGHRRGHVRFAIQDSAKSGPAFLMELSTPTSVLVREMASGMVRIALECDRKLEKRGVGLLEEPLWRAYCNGRKCGYAMRRECGAEERRVLTAVGPISMGAGVLPVAAAAAVAGDGAVGSEENGGDGGGGGEVMYMRAKFERVVGSKDSEAFYMMNPNDGGYGCPELSLYLLRV